MLGNFDRARDLIASAISLTADLGLEIARTGMRFQAAEIELLAGDPSAAERFARDATETLESIGNNGHYVTVAPILAEALVLLEREHEADEIVELVIRRAIDDDLDPQIGWRRIRAMVLARRDDLENAERVARESVKLALKTDFLDHQARSLICLADVLDRAGRPQECIAELENAAQVWERKGNVVRAAATRTRQTELNAARAEQHR
jgi:hypothetical protein